jgi:uncharacterized protein YaiE (UPF0345 family)
VRLRSSHLALLGSAALIGAVWAAPSASALDDTKPSPTCAGMNFTDPEGDAALDLTGAGVGTAPAPDNMDITGGFFKYDPDASGAASLTANIQVKNLTKDVPPGATGVRWYYFWEVGGQQYFVEGAIDATGEDSYEYGHTEQILMSDGSTRGRMFEGPNGIIQIAVPQSGTGARDGARLSAPYASSRASFDLVAVAYIPTADDGPNNQAGRTYTVAQCPTGPTTVALPVRLATSSVRAAQAKKGRSLSFRLQSTETVTDVSGALKKGKTTYGTGKLSTVNGRGTLKVKLKRAMKKGSYKLDLNGTTSNGAATASFNVRVR